MKIAFLFAGQGSQVVGMGKDIYDNFDVKDIYDKSNIKDICFAGPQETLNQTKYAQVAILTTSLAIAAALKSKGITPEYVAGLSLGEYSALTFSDAIQVSDAIEIVTKRGQIMQDALPLGKSSMAAVLNLDSETILKTICQIDGVCEIANYNCPSQIVITGDMEAIDAAIPLLTEAGARKVIKLNVSGAFHSSLLTDASKSLRRVLDQYTFNVPKYNVVYNISGTTLTDSIPNILEQQIKSSVKFEQSIHYMIEQGVDTFIEIGPGTTLAGFVKKTNKDVKVFSANDTASIENIINQLK